MTEQAQDKSSLVERRDLTMAHTTEVAGEQGDQDTSRIGKLQGWALEEREKGTRGKFAWRKQRNADLSMLEKHSRTLKNGERYFSPPRKRRAMMGFPGS